MTTIEGGMICTNSKKIYELSKIFRSHGMAREAKRRGYDGVVCGHIHKAELRTINGITYANDGDWVESLTALAENHDGSLEILDYSKNFETLHLKKYDKKQLISSM